MCGVASITGISLKRGFKGRDSLGRSKLSGVWGESVLHIKSLRRHLQFRSGIDPTRKTRCLNAGYPTLETEKENSHFYESSKDVLFLAQVVKILFVKYPFMLSSLMRRMFSRVHVPDMSVSVPPFSSIT